MEDQCDETGKALEGSSASLPPLSVGTLIIPLDRTGWGGGESEEAKRRGPTVLPRVSACGNQSHREPGQPGGWEPKPQGAGARGLAGPHTGRAIPLSGAVSLKTLRRGDKVSPPHGAILGNRIDPGRHRGGSLRGDGGMTEG